MTAPYKQLVAGLVDEVEADARAIGAVNNVVRTDDGRLVGFNTDAPGFRAGVELAMGRSLAGADVVVAGAGGAAHAVVFACLRAGARAGDGRQPDVGVGRGAGRRFAASARARAARRPRRAGVRRRARRAPTWPSTRRRSGWSIPGIDDRRRAAAGDGATVFDLRLRPGRDAALAAARARGLRAANGSEMLIAQAAIAFERWTGVGGMADVMRDGRRAAPRRPDRRGPDRDARGRAVARQPGAIYTIGLNYRGPGEPPTPTARSGRSSTARPPARSRATARR